LSGCHASAGPDPASAYQGIYDDYLHGNLDAARAGADKARKEFSTAGSQANPSWEMKFRLLQAEILFKQNHLDGTLSLLTDGASFPAEGDLAIKRNLLLGLSQFYLGQTQDSERELGEARRLAEASRSRLMGEVLRAEATVQRRSGALDKATETFTSSLAAAREHHDLLLQANDLVDLGLVSLQSGHYDQALAWSLEAERFAASIQARRQLQWALGNKGWAYQNLGDFEHALHDFQAAGSLAKELGMSGSRLLWLQDAGLAEYKLGKLEEARTYDEEALQSALNLPASSADQIANIRTNLALLLYDQGQYDAAKSNSEAAVIAARI
jgi:tetratricopeptide (TPR) repeat protein